MADFSEFKVAVFEGINDTPRVPTSIQAGNGSDLIDKLNSLCDYLSENLATVATTGNYDDLINEPETSSLNWEVGGVAYQGVTTVVITGTHFTRSFNNGVLTINFSGDAGTGGGGEA